METASLILSVISLIISLFCIIWLLSKHFSTHQVQLVDPFEKIMNGHDPIDGKPGKKMMSEYADLESFKGDEDIPQVTKR